MGTGPLLAHLREKGVRALARRRLPDHEAPLENLRRARKGNSNALKVRRRARVLPLLRGVFSRILRLLKAGPLRVGLLRLLMRVERHPTGCHT